jgi:uncharacterized protein (TIGR02996 family)
MNPQEKDREFKLHGCAKPHRSIAKVDAGGHMDREAAFLGAIRSSPEDTLARLAYADWLEEQGDVRGEYLRLDAQMRDSSARLAELRKQIDPKWLADVNQRELCYTDAYHLTCELRLRSGRSITLERLDQVMTYAGLLEGTPNHEMNDRHIQYALNDAARRGSTDARPYLIDPKRRDYRRKPGDMKRTIERSPYWIPEWLPMVQCTGFFRGSVTPRHPESHISILTVVWFQEDYAPPVQEPALTKLLDLDWDNLALDVEL